ncbi:type II toxin-antitoxin system death-on-curing family toxin [Sporomusa malonica]|uniref:Death on curing protein n=1 Tax=Sporomusa malonica TaxID=112901 RepID=A0A1W2CSV4_9FIRM|nr:type II toxin-antitoxin system death-on-curing family toxin [Sporomusa malonica]SMC88317.1 death on curing protein [Sporomusa malonica]
MRTLSLSDIILLHRKLIDQTGGAHGVRDMGLLESALNRAHASFDGEDFYTTVESKIAAITYGLVNNHSFIDGNKRIGIAAMLLLLRINGYCLNYSQDELIWLGLGIAAGSLSETEIIQWIRRHQVV